MEIVSTRRELIYKMEINLLCLMLMFSSAMAAQGSIFSDLSIAELEQVTDYLAAQQELNLVWGDDVTERSSYVQTIEVLQPIKSEALDYLDHNGPEPVRKARVILIRSDARSPSVQEYEVFPIPNPTSHVMLLYSNKRDPIPYHSRTVGYRTSRKEMWKILQKEIRKVDPYLKTITGMSFYNCSEDCLTQSYGGGASFDGTNQTILVGLYRGLEESALHPIGLELLIEMNTPDVSKWKIIWVSFRGKSFSSFDSLREYFTNLSPKPDSHIPVANKDLPSSLNFRGDPRPQQARAGPVTFYPNGPRFSVRENHVEWLGWSLDLAMPTTTGLRIHDIRFLSERIIYELSLQDIAVFYSGDDPIGAHTNFFDAHYNMGTTFSRMFPGVDCPDNAKFLNTVHYFKGKPTTFNDTICVFEMNQGVPFRRHFASDFDGGYRYYQGMPDNVLIVRSILTVDNYDYMLDVVLYQAGQIEVRVSLTGYVIGSYYTGDTHNTYGYQIGEESTRGNIHLHVCHIKVDLDVKGTKNRFRSMTIEKHQYPDPLDNSKQLTNKRITEWLRKTEREGAYRYNFETPSYLVLYNEDYKNRFGNSKGYRILNQAMAKMILPESYGGSRSRSWANYQVSVTRRKDSEPYSSSPYTFMEQQNPVVAFEDFIDDDESIVDQDLVAWITMGAHHIPHSEDVPIVTTPGVKLSFILSPYNYFDEDPSLASRDNIRITPGEEAGEAVYQYSGVPGGTVCNKPGVTCEGTTGNVESKDGTFVEVKCDSVEASNDSSRVRVLVGLIVATLLYVLS